MKVNNMVRRRLEGKVDCHPYRDQLDRKSQLGKYLTHCICLHLSLSQEALRGLSWANVFLLGGLARNTRDVNVILFWLYYVFFSKGIVLFGMGKSN